MIQRSYYVIAGLLIQRSYYVIAGLLIQRSYYVIAGLLIQRSYYVIAELLEGDGTEPGQETNNCKGQSYVSFPVSLRRYSTKEKLICVSG